MTWTKMVNEHPRGSGRVPIFSTIILFSDLLLQLTAPSASVSSFSSHNNSTIGSIFHFIGGILKLGRSS